ncbi:hypothetical protein CYMTET_41737 [Cymbomonas tetramitiformis]|uniref:Uncharacterized protein n=1 Tax=Cymbomonas tetramitiformis TaxID=36881 RepID=A0AAE0F2C6_9CHLO|nr:hypothetical protein CYMTET_41737 [Cymbomonas tetramitiformis]
MATSGAVTRVSDSASWWESVLRLRKNYAKNAVGAYIELLNVLRASDRHIPRLERAMLKRVIREMRTDVQGPSMPWSRVDKQKFAKAIFALAMRVKRCKRAQPKMLEDKPRSRRKSVKVEAKDENAPPPAWLGVLRGVELLSTTNAAPIKRVVEAAMDMGAREDMTPSDSERLKKALTSVKKGGTYKFNNGRCLKQTVLAILSVYVSKYPSPIPYMQLSLSQPVRRERKSTAEIDKRHEAGEDWHATLHSLCRMVCNNARPMKRLLRIAMRQSEGIPAVHASISGILQNTPCESNSCSLVKREVRAFLSRYDASPSSKILGCGVDTLSVPNRQTLEAKAAERVLDDGLAIDSDSSTAGLYAEEVLLAAMSGDGTHEYAIRCDRADMEKIFRYVSSLDRSSHTDVKLRDALGPHASIPTSSAMELAE